MPTPCTEEEKKKMIKYYKKGLTAKEAGARVGRSESACLAVLRSSKDVKVREAGYTKYSLNEEFFDNPDSENKLYWLGFLTSDGHVGRDNNKIIIHLQYGDRGHLKKFKNDLNAEQPVVKTTSGEHDKATFAITRKHVAETLRNDYDLHKGNYARIPNLEPHLMRHYWRGMIDGDGSIFKTGNKKNGVTQYGVSFHNGKKLVRGFSDHIFEELGFRLNVRPSQNIYVVKTGGIRKVHKILNLLYDKASIYLKRKYERYKEAMQYEYDRCMDIEKYSRDDLVCLKEAHGRWENVANVIGCGYSTLWRYRARIGMDVSRENAQKKLKKTTKEEIEILYDRLGKWGLVADELNVSPNTLLRKRKELGMPVKQYG